MWSLLLVSKKSEKKNSKIWKTYFVNIYRSFRKKPFISNHTKYLWYQPMSLVEVNQANISLVVLYFHLYFFMYRNGKRGHFDSFGSDWKISFLIKIFCTMEWYSRRPSYRQFLEIFFHYINISFQMTKLISR